MENGNCFEGWVFGEASEPFCPNCPNRTSCAACHANVNCMWCQKFGNCKDLASDDTTCIQQTNPCTCDVHEHCDTCGNDNSCWWCETYQRCFSLDNTQVKGCVWTPPKPVCPTCDQIPDCQRCLQTSGCGFCGSSVSASGLEKRCPVAECSPSDSAS